MKLFDIQARTQLNTILIPVSLTEADENKVAHLPNGGWAFFFGGRG